MKTLAPVLLSALLAVSAVAQEYAFHPQNPDPWNTGSQNNYPFGPAVTAGFTFVDHVPASALDPANPLITDFSVWTRGAGSWSSNNVKIAIGHLPTPAPCPLTFPDGPGGGRDR